MRLLLVEDELGLRDSLARSFEREGHDVFTAADAYDALAHAERDAPDLILLDVALGAGPDGYEVCRSLRERRDVVPIIMLTARDSEEGAVEGLEAGADDYVTKPFGAAELRSRIRAVLRRAAAWQSDEDTVTVGEVTLRWGDEVAIVRGERIRLTFSEARILATLLAAPGRAFRRQELLRSVWGDDGYRDPRAIDVHVRHLREKLEKQPDEPRLIRTVRGVGYSFHPI
jgi:two-component system, OmpR family, response regulator RegX3